MNEEKEIFLNQIKGIVADLGYECVHVGIRTEFGRLKIQVFIDTFGGISVDDCELVSGRIGKFLDENSASKIPELEKERYYLEVSSPGIERPLYTMEDYIRFQGCEARIRLSKLHEGRKTFTGIINSAADGHVNIICEGVEKHLLFENIKGGHLIYRFENENENENKKRNKKGRKRK